MENILEIEEAVNNIEFAVSTSSCVRISIFGNENVIPTKETVDNAIISVERMLENQTRIIDEETDKLCSNLKSMEQKDSCNDSTNNNLNKEYKKEIIEMIQKCNNKRWLRAIYIFVKQLLE